jgi:hypothetical protein
MKKIKKIGQFSLVACMGLGLIFAGIGCKGDTQGKKEPVVTKKIASRPQAPKATPKGAQAEKKATVIQAQVAPETFQAGPVAL